MLRYLLTIVLLYSNVSTFGTDLLIQGRSDTIRALRHILLHTKRSVGTHPITSEAKMVFAEAIVDSTVVDKMSVRRRRSITNAVVESAHCEHIDLVDCSEYSTQEMSCMLTATGMTCCVCTGRLVHLKMGWTLFR